MKNFNHRPWPSPRQRFVFYRLVGWLLAAVVLATIAYATYHIIHHQTPTPQPNGILRNA